MMLVMALLAQSPSDYDPQFQREQAALASYAACLDRENERRLEAGRTDLSDYAASCAAERLAITRLDGRAGRSPDGAAALLRGFDDGYRGQLSRRNARRMSGHGTTDRAPM